MTGRGSLSCCWRTPDLTVGCSLLDCRTCVVTMHLSKRNDSTGVGIHPKQCCPPHQFHTVQSAASLQAAQHSLAEEVLPRSVERKSLP